MTLKFWKCESLKNDCETLFQSNTIFSYNFLSLYLFWVNRTRIGKLEIKKKIDNQELKELSFPNERSKN